MNILHMMFWIGLVVGIGSVFAWKRYSEHTEQKEKKIVPMGMSIVAFVLIAIPAFGQKNTVINIYPHASQVSVSQDL